MLMYVNILSVALESSGIPQPYYNSIPCQFEQTFHRLSTHSTYYVSVRLKSSMEEQLKTI